MPDLLICILITIIVLIGSLILLSLSRLIVNFFEKIVTPRIYKLTDESSIVLKQDFEVMREESLRFEKKFELEREARLKLQNEYEQLETRLGQVLQKNNSEKEEPKTKVRNSENALRKILDDKEKRESFKKMVDIVLNKRHVRDNDMTDLMLRLNLVEKGNTDFNGVYNFVFTPTGIKLREMLIEHELNETSA